MTDVPLIAWIAAGMLAFIFVALNIGMVALLRNPDKFKLQRKAPRNSAPGMGNLVKVLRDPFGEEREQLQELSNLVKELDGKQPPEEDSSR